MRTVGVPVTFGRRGHALHHLGVLTAVDALGDSAGRPGLTGEFDQAGIVGVDAAAFGRLQFLGEERGVEAAERVHRLVCDAVRRVAGP